MPPPTRPDKPVVVIGAGLAGLACAHELRQRGLPAVVLEASDAVGGRVRTDEVETNAGRFLIDRGFQVYLTAYPEGRRVLRLNELRLRPFLPGAMVRFEGRFWRATDPVRDPLGALSMLRSPLLTKRDLAALALFDLRLRCTSEARCWNAPDQTSEEFLQAAGISQRAIERFFRPFFGGVFLDRSLQTSARKLRAKYRMFARGRAALPSAGMGMIPTQLARRLGPGVIRLATRVGHVAPGEVTTQDGQVIEASSIVVATDGEAASTLVPGVAAPAWKRTLSLSYAAPEAPAREPILYLDGDGSGPANHVAVISNVQPTYAPKGHALVSASVVAPHLPDDADETLERRVRAQLRDWFGPGVDHWEHLRTDHIRHALPSEDAPGPLAQSQRPVETEVAGVFIAGDHVDNGSINGALQSGRRAAGAILARGR